MEVLFASLQHHCFWCFFWSRGPKLCPNRTGNTKFYKNLTRVCAYTRFPLSPVCPGTSRNKGNFSKKIYSTISTDRLEQNSEDVGFFHASTYTVDAWKNPKIESCYTIFGCGNGAILVILFKTLFDHFHFYPLVALKCYPHLISCHNEHVSPPIRLPG